MDLKEVLSTYESIVVRLLSLKKPVSITNGRLHTGKCEHSVDFFAAAFGVKTYVHLSEDDVISLNAVGCVKCRNTTTARIKEAQGVIFNRIVPLRNMLKVTSADDFSFRFYGSIIEAFVNSDSADHALVYNISNVKQSKHLRLVDTAFKESYKLWYEYFIGNVPKKYRLDNTDMVYAFSVGTTDFTTLVPKTQRRNIVRVGVYEHPTARAVLYKGPYTAIMHLRTNLEFLYPGVQHADLAKVEELAFALLRDGMGIETAFTAALALES